MTTLTEEEKRKIVQATIFVRFRYKKQSLDTEARFSGVKLSFPHLLVRVDLPEGEWADFGEYSWSTAKSFMEMGQPVYL